ncbi:MAG: hypothetical protein PHP25_05435 [Candidatus Moranbacteria bacterium]|nr:hypothetical protein [Candidatus Moranbacteria bacterium]
MSLPTSKIKQESLKIISSYFGEKNANFYEKKFEGKTDAMILVMVRALLGEYLGRDQTEIHMSSLHKLIENK